MPSVKLRIIDDEQGSGMGWVLADMGEAVEGEPTAAYDGRLVAHDVLEHQNGPEAVGGIADEIEALGGAYFIRGVTGRLDSRFVGAVESLAFDVGRMFSLDWYGDLMAADSVANVATDEDEALRHIAARSLKAWADEGFHDAGEDEDSGPRLSDARRAYRLLKQGYAKAYAAWHGDSHAALAQFDAIADAVDAVRHRLTEENEGLTATLTYGDGAARLTVDEPDWEYLND